nr:immunoglobulin light chain junction region [Macaca mulatta]MOW53578.1 immunoglobulin light chain junction region [Macaca mulatta]MOW54752.1 immunoglobulin light chain junction region [Macaca mulatta]MOW54769.1 immunoglobulin light chain junction region [Macaca mulatta]MOW54861.1 immunoglobulin light chain junction region [Macaca mulatta]
CMQSMELPFTF